MMFLTSCFCLFCHMFPNSTDAASASATTFKLGKQALQICTKTAKPHIQVREMLTIRIWIHQLFGFTSSLPSSSCQLETKDWGHLFSPRTSALSQRPPAGWTNLWSPFFFCYLIPSSAWGDAWAEPAFLMLWPLKPISPRPNWAALVAGYLKVPFHFSSMMSSWSKWTWIIRGHVGSLL
jgi:hypothetical protein